MSISSFRFGKTKKTYEAKLLTSAKYMNTSYMSVASQSKGLKLLLIFCNPKPKPQHQMLNLTLKLNPNPTVHNLRAYSHMRPSILNFAAVHM